MHMILLTVEACQFSIKILADLSKNVFECLQGGCVKEFSAVL